MIHPYTVRSKPISTKSLGRLLACFLSLNEVVGVRPRYAARKADAAGSSRGRRKFISQQNILVSAEDRVHANATGIRPPCYFQAISEVRTLPQRNELRYNRNNIRILIVIVYYDHLRWT